MAPRGLGEAPTPSPLDMNLSGEERRALEAIERRYRSPYRDGIGAKIVLLADLGRSIVIASRLDTPRQIVSKWLQAIRPGRTARPGGAASRRE
jgi:hypothetical protein